MSAPRSDTAMAVACARTCAKARRQGREGCRRAIRCNRTAVGPLRAKKAGEAEVADDAMMQELAQLKQRAEEMFKAEPDVGMYEKEELSLDQSELSENVRKTCEMIEKGLIERDTEVRLMILAALCGEHLLLLGPPGTAKSELGRRLSAACGGRFFERLLTRFSVPEELFGPLSMKGLENDQYVRQVDGYLPTAEVAFIDEIFKANSAILNSLLTLLNERLFDNGKERVPVPLLCMVGASNELPESEELDALYDRFLIRKEVNQCSAKGLRDLAVLASTGGTSGNFSVTERFLSLDDYRGSMGKAIQAVEFGDELIDMLIEMRQYLQEKCEPPIYISDRRFTKAITLLQTAAYANGATSVSKYDLLLLEHVLGQRPGDEAKVRQWVLDRLGTDPGLLQAELAFLGLFGRGCRALGSAPGGGAASEDLQELKSDVDELVQELRSKQQELGSTLEGEFPLLRGNVWLGANSVAGAAQNLGPALRENKLKVESLLNEVLVLHSCLERPAHPGVLEKLLPKRLKQYEKGISQQ